MDKKALTETHIRTKFIRPAITAEWDVMLQVLEERYFTKGRVIVRGKMTARGEAKKADYILFHKPNLPLAIVEAKDNNHTVGAGMQQALEYAEILDVPFAFSSNGDAFLEHDRLTKRRRSSASSRWTNFLHPRALATLLPRQGAEPARRIRHHRGLLRRPVRQEPAVLLELPRQ